MWNIDNTRCMFHSLYSCFGGLGPTWDEDTEAEIPCLHSKIETNTLPAAMSLAPATRGMVTVDLGSVIACHITPAPHECWAIANPTRRRKFAKTYDLTIHLKRGRRARDRMIWIGAGSGQDCHTLQTYSCVANGLECGQGGAVWGSTHVPLQHRPPSMQPWSTNANHRRQEAPGRPFPSPLAPRQQSHRHEELSSFGLCYYDVVKQRWLWNDATLLQEKMTRFPLSRACA